MIFNFFKLPFKKSSLNPFLSEETLIYHHEKHHNTYVSNLNKLTTNNISNKNIEEIIKTESGALFNNAAQIFNHNFYWNSLSDNSSKKPTGEVLKSIEKTYNSFSNFKNYFNSEAMRLFGSGWIWLVSDYDKISVKITNNAGCPLFENEKLLLVLDLWEHSYYIDYRNNKLKYINLWWDFINWNFVENNFINK